MKAFIPLPFSPDNYNAFRPEALALAQRAFARAASLALAAALMGRLGCCLTLDGLELLLFAQRAR